MNLSAPFIYRPVATTLLTLAVLLSGALSYGLLPVSPLPQIEFPTIQVSAGLPGASPETMASSVATPLERQFARIAGVTEMSSTSSLGEASITLQFSLDRDVNAAARDVQAAINAARSQLPANLPNNPSYRMVNPADPPIMMLALTSDYHTKERMYDIASTILQQKVSQVKGVGQVFVGGGALPAVRVAVNPTVLNHLGLDLSDVRQTLVDANANRPKGSVSNDEQHWELSTSDQLFDASEYAPLIVAYRNDAPIRLSDVAEVTNGLQDIRSFGIFNGKAAITLMMFREPGANIIETVDGITALLPQMRAQIPATMQLDIAMDRTATIRASLHDVQFTLMLSVGLVILVVFLFLRDLRTTIIPSVAVPVSLIGTFGVMYLLGYSLDNLSLMALTIATGFVVDDAIVVVENISRHLEDGMKPFEAAIQGAREIGFTVLSISVSLIAVFLPILLMGGIVGRLFREFAVTLSAAIIISLVISLTTTPMMCAYMLKSRHDRRPSFFYRISEGFFDGILALYSWCLRIVLRYQRITMVVTLATIAFTVYLYVIVPKGFFPQQDTGRLMANITADQDTSFQAMVQTITAYAAIFGADPDITSVSAYAGGRGASNSSRMFIGLKPKAERSATTDQIMGRLRKQLSQVPGASVFMMPIQDIRIGGRASSAQYQYTLQASDLLELNTWSPLFLEEFRKIPGIVDVNSDQQDRGLQKKLEIDRLTASRLGLSVQQIDNALYDAFGQRQVSTIYKDQNQYRVVMGLEQQYVEKPEDLKHIFLKTPSGTSTPLSEVYQPVTETTSLSVAHSGQFPSVTISFNLEPGISLSQVVPHVDDLVNRIQMPMSIQGRFQGAVQAYQDTTRTQPALILAALITVYIVLGILYESYLHPITILSTIPSSGVGALLALMWFGSELNMMALIGILLLIGIVKKNAIMMIDFAIEAERSGGLSPLQAIYQASVLRFRPITMTTMAALLGALPLALGTGEGSELRRPMGIAIVGGLIMSQALTIFTTPVVYLYVDRFRIFMEKRRKKSRRIPNETQTETPNSQDHPELIQV